MRRSSGRRRARWEVLLDVSHIREGWENGGNGEDGVSYPILLFFLRCEGILRCGFGWEGG